MIPVVDASGVGVIGPCGCVFRLLSIGNGEFALFEVEE